MELIPIIKLALVVFTGVVGILMIVSYFIYKIKNSKVPKRSEIQAQSVKQFVTSSHKAKTQTLQTPAVAQNDQAYYVPQRKAHENNVKQKPILAPRERFQVLNSQNVEVRPALINAEQERAFYQPGTNYNVFTPSHTARSLFDRYSHGNDRLHKLKFNGNA
jgi:serine/threonine protein kinase HipA of HipAB toxin-antitoxin module